MKKALTQIGSGFVILLLLNAQPAQAQNKQGFGIHFSMYDFYGPQTDKYFFADKAKYTYNESEGIYDTSLQKRLYWTPSVKFTYWNALNKHLDLSLGLSLASIDYPDANPDENYINRSFYNISDAKKSILLTEFDARINYNIIPKDDYILSPYVFAGINASYHSPYFGADIPLGLGLNVNLSKNDDIFFNLESAYKIAASEHDQNHLQHSLGFVYWFKPGYKAKKERTPELAEILPPADTDNDGVVDSLDSCPSIAGLQQFNGCPDSDNDGIADDKDECPLVAGKAEYNGCPDSDGDGINDKQDQCPYVAGIADRNGCPIPDKDNDGFNDDEDRCPDQYSKTNGGCPEIRREIINKVQKAAKAIFFETGKATIKKASYKQLDAIVAVLKEDPSLYADIEGHTDNVGNDDRNMELSQQRAEAVMNYFSGKGITSDRMTAKGFGETQPVATNATAAGRAQNRRTEIKLRNYKQ